MNNLLRFNKFYFIATVLLFVIEVLIARYVDDRFVRPYLGDVLVAVLVYCFARSFLNVPVVPIAIASLLFCYLVETFQYLNIVEKLGLQRSQVARTVMGTSFEWTDMFAYTCGIVAVLIVERMLLKKRAKAAL